MQPYPTKLFNKIDLGRIGIKEALIHSLASTDELWSIRQLNFHRYRQVIR